MADTIIAAQQSATIPNPSANNAPMSELDKRTARNLAFDIEDDLNRVRRLNDLASWITDARSVLTGVRRAAERDAQLMSLLKGVGIYSADWVDDQDEAMKYLHMAIGDYLDNVRSACGLGSFRTDAEEREGAI
jgi:hypothetical protein